MSTDLSMAGTSESDDYGSYEPPTSFWSIVEGFVPDHERTEVKNLLGESLVEQSLELHKEVSCRYCMRTCTCIFEFKKKKLIRHTTIFKCCWA